MTTFDGQNDEQLSSSVVAPGVSPGGTKKRVPSGDLFVEKKDKGSVVAANERPSISYWQDAWFRLKRNKVAMIAGAYIVALALAALIIPEILPYSYEDQQEWNQLAYPTFSDIELSVAGSDSLDYKEKTTDPGEPAFLEVDAPTGVRLIGKPLTIGVAVEWDPVPGAAKYLVFRSEIEGSQGVPLPDVPANILSFIDRSPLRADTTYYYSIVAVNGGGDYSPSSEPIGVHPIRTISLADAVEIDPAAKAGSIVRVPPHYLGTDHLGRDMLSRVMIGARVSLFIGFGAPLLYVLIGVIYGAISGYFGGLVDDIMMRITDIMTTLPELLVVILLQVVMGTGIFTLITAMVLVAWSRSARQIRGEVLRLREQEFVHASTILATPFHKVIFRHLLPNVMGTVLIILTLSIPSAIFTEAFLSFIGLGIAPPMASWGTVTKEAAKVFQTFPHLLIIPSLLISVTMLSFNLFGDGLRDALDPKMRGTQ